MKMPTSPAEQMREACARVAADFAIDMRLEADRDGHGATLRAMHQATAYTAEQLAAAIRALPAPDEWQGIETAPYNTPVCVKVGRMTFEATLWGGASVDSDGNSCDQWIAEHDGEHPPCWSEGACWSVNEDGDACLQPLAWRPLPAAPSPEGSGDA